MGQDCHKEKVAWHDAPDPYYGPMDEPPANSARLVAATLIDQVLAGELPPEKALDEWPRSNASDRALMNNAWTALSHFADDADIHERDREYLDAERHKLQEYASRLRSERLK